MNNLNPELKEEELNQVSGGVSGFDQTPFGLKLKCKRCGGTNVRAGDRATYFTCCDCGNTFQLSTDSSPFLF